MSVIKGRISKTTALTVNDDSSKGFYVGFKWTNSVTTTVYEAISVAIGGAVWKQIPITNNEVVVNQLTQFGTPSGGKYTLSANTRYIISDSINIGTNYLQLAENTSLSGISPFISAIIYTGTGGAIRGTDTNGYMENIAISAATATAEAIVLSNVAKNKSFVVANCVFNACDKIGSVTGFFDFALNFSQFTSNINGFTFIGVLHLFIQQCLFHDSNSGTYISAPSGTFEDIIIENNHMDIPIGRTGINIAASTVIITEVATIVSNILNGAGTIYTGFSVSNLRYNVKANVGIPNFISQASMVWSNVAGTMTLSAADGWKKITGNTSISSNLKRFTHTSPNNLTYIGLTPITVKINISCAVYYTSGGAFISSIGLSKGGVMIPSSDNGFTIYSADEPCSTSIITSLVTGDTIQGIIKKFVGASTNIVVSFLNIQINELT